MTAAAAGAPPALPRADSAGALVRWPACLALVLALHAAAVLALLRRQDLMEPPALPAEAIMIDLAPVPEAPPVAEEAPPAEPEPEPAEAPPPPPEPVAEMPLEPSPEPLEQVTEIPPEPPPEPQPPEPPPTVAPEVVLPQPPPPPPPPMRPVARPQTQSRPTPVDRRAVAESRQTAETPPAPAVAQPPPSNAVPTWQGQLLGRLQRFKRYPDLARSRREEGVVHLTFAMDREGRVLAASIAKGSGFPELDAETLALVRRAEPLPQPPPEMPGNPITLTVPVRFSLR